MLELLLTLLANDLLPLFRLLLAPLLQITDLLELLLSPLRVQLVLYRVLRDLLLHPSLLLSLEFGLAHPELCLLLLELLSQHLLALLRLRLLLLSLSELLEEAIFVECCPFINFVFEAANHTHLLFVLNLEDAEVLPQSLA